MRLKSVAAVIDAFGGTGAMAQLFDVVPGAVSNWRTEDRFPERLHYRIHRESVKRGWEVDPTVFEAGPRTLREAV